ncbi:MAG: hypothetical protein KF915_20315 [Polyangiaceae bacterium]|nr:hypothetical protein [Polyangiaceae bacterium]
MAQEPSPPGARAQGTGRRPLASRLPWALGVDLSTSAVKAIAWGLEGEEAGKALFTGRAAIDLTNPSPLAWEQDANEWYRALGEACRALSDAMSDRLPSLVGVSLAHQRETVVLTDPEGAPLGPARVWMDQRGEVQVTRATQALGASFLHQTTGKPPCTTASFYKLAAWFEEAPELRARCHISCVHGFIARRLLGRHVSSLASVDPMGLLHLTQLDYAAPLLDFLGVREHQLPRLAVPGEHLGGLTQEAAAHTGLRAGTPLFAGAGDGQAAGLGAGVCAPGEAYLNLGTALVSGTLSHDYVTDLNYRTMLSAAPRADWLTGKPSYFLETDLKGGTFTFDWLAGRLLAETDDAGGAGSAEGTATGGAGRPEGAETGGAERTASAAEAAHAQKNARLEALAERARSLPPGAEGLMLVPYWAGVMNPYWDDAASGITIGWRGHHGAHHLYRAALEGLALEQRLHTSGVEASAGSISQLVTLGGLSDAAWVRQLFADAMRRPIVAAGNREATSLGAAVLAAVGAGVFPSAAAAARTLTSRGERHEPGAQAPAYDALFAIYRELFPSLRGALQALARLSPER